MYYSFLNHIYLDNLTSSLDINLAALLDMDVASSLDINLSASLDINASTLLDIDVVNSLKESTTSLAQYSELRHYE